MKQPHERSETVKEAFERLEASLSPEPLTSTAPERIWLSSEGYTWKQPIKDAITYVRADLVPQDRDILRKALKDLVGEIWGSHEAQTICFDWWAFDAAEKALKDSEPTPPASEEPCETKSPSE